MKKLTFKKQIIMGIVFLILMFICSTVFKNGVFSNIGWVVYGLLFVINPVCPNRSESVKNVRLWVRLAGIIVILLGISIHFGV